MEYIKLAVSDFMELAPVYTGQHITMKLTAQVINRELENGVERVVLIPEVIELIRDEKRANPSEVLLSSIDRKLGMAATPVP